MFVKLAALQQLNIYYLLKSTIKAHTKYFKTYF